VSIFFRRAVGFPSIRSPPSAERPSASPMFDGAASYGTLLRFHSDTVTGPTGSPPDAPTSFSTLPQPMQPGLPLTWTPLPFATKTAAAATQVNPYPTAPTWASSATLLSTLPAPQSFPLPLPLSPPRDTPSDPERRIPLPPLTPVGRSASTPSPTLSGGFEEVTKYTFDFGGQTWATATLRVRIDAKPFGKGGLRYAHRMVDSDGNQYAAKVSRQPRPSEWYFEDVVMQATSQHYATLYNQAASPKKVWFIDTFVIRQSQIPGSGFATCETFLEGKYAKYNNNAGWVADDDRNTPQAFSHFTYVASLEQLMVVDIQGVGDWYTDPQIHSRDRRFGSADLGPRGFLDFLRTHKCNHICLGLNLGNQLQSLSGTLMDQKAAKLMSSPASGPCQRMSPEQGSCSNSAIGGAKYCKLHRCPLCSREKASGATMCPAHAIPAAPSEHPSPVQPFIFLGATPHAYTADVPHFNHDNGAPSGAPTTSAAHLALLGFAALQANAPSPITKSLKAPSTCQRASPNGLCPAAPAPGSVFCSRHRCPQCGGEKASNAPFCAVHARQPLPAPGAVEGTIKSFSHKSGWGFIQLAHNSSPGDVLFHRADVCGVPVAKLRPGLPVTCRVIHTEKGQKAKEVAVAEPPDGQ
jgi:cold shock CspA family protein